MINDTNNDELWLVVKDKNNKKIKTHIKFDIEQYVQSNMMDMYYYINYIYGLIENKNLATIKKNINGILYAKKQIEKFNHVQFRTDEQALLVYNDIMNMINKFNSKVRHSINLFFSPNMRTLLIDYTTD
jgi:hypothetical protein